LFPEVLSEIKNYQKFKKLNFSQIFILFSKIMKIFDDHNKASNL